MTDVRDSEQVDAALQRTRTDLGIPSILVNNAGGVFSSPLLEASENGWDALYRSNLRHVLLCTQRVARVLVDAGRPGSIINLTSIEGVRAAPGYAAYAAARPASSTTPRPRLSSWPRTIFESMRSLRT